jgi:hypothetical protein
MACQSPLANEPFGPMFQCCKQGCTRPRRVGHGFVTALVHELVGALVKCGKQRRRGMTERRW